MDGNGVNHFILIDWSEGWKQWKEWVKVSTFLECTVCPEQSCGIGHSSPTQSYKFRVATHFSTRFRVIELHALYVSGSSIVKQASQAVVVTAPPTIDQSVVASCDVSSRYSIIVYDTLSSRVWLWAGQYLARECNWRVLILHLAPHDRWNA